VAGLGLFYQKGTIAMAMPAVTAFKFCIAARLVPDCQKSEKVASYAAGKIPAGLIDSWPLEQLKTMRDRAMGF
jgi:hypothetical protein